MSGEVVDADGHIMEPSDLWEKNIEPRFRDRALRIRKDEDGLEYMEIDGRKSKIMNGGSFGGYSGIGATLEEREAIWFKSGGIEYEDARFPAARDPDERIGWMDEKGIDASVLYPSMGISWQTECPDPKLAAAYCRVYNDWLSDFCRGYPDRLVAVAQVPLIDVEEGVAEIRRAAGLGMKSVYLFSHPANGIRYGDPYYDPFWAEAQALEMPVAIHVSHTPEFVGHDLYANEDGQGRGPGEIRWFHAMLINGDCVIALTTMFAGAVFERFPRLRVGVVETGCGWIPHWLGWMDARYEMLKFESPLSCPPSEYFARQCFVSGEPDERHFADTARQIGAANLVWGSDYPHVEGHAEPVRDLEETLESLPAPERRKILGENAMALYHIGKTGTQQQEGRQGSP